MDWRRQAAGIAAGCFAMLAIDAGAQFIPQPFLSGETRGRVVDAESGRPIEGVVVVARWEWLTYDPGNLHRGPSYVNAGQAVHVGEAITDGSGGFAIAGWGPKYRVGGTLAENLPRVFAFKAGYEPLQVDGPTVSPLSLRLRKFAGEPKQYAALIAAFQGGERNDRGLLWRATPDADAMPRMVLALHREKARLGGDGSPIRGGNVLPGRAGKGQVIDESRQPVTTGGVVFIAWTMRRIDGAPGTRRLVETKKLGIEGSSANFYVSPWRFPAPEMAGWERATDVRPLVRVYATGYRRSNEVRWEDGGGVIAIGKLPETREGRLEEMRAMRRDMDAELAAGERPATLGGLGPMLWRFADLCRGITPDLRAGLCYDDSSDEAKQVEITRRAGSFLIENAEDSQEIRIVSSGSGSAQASAVSAAPGGYRPPVRIGGFSIEPVR